MPATLPELDPILEEATPPPVKRPNWLRRFLTMRFLVISIVVHLLLGLGAAVWVVQTYSASRKLTFKGGPPSPNRSTRAIEHKVQMAKKQSTMSAPATKRIVSTGLSKVTLPEMPAMPKTATAPNKMAGAGGTNLGAAAGPMGAASTQSGGGLVSMFGLREAGGGSLVGNFYDLKQDKAGKPTEMGGPSDEKELNSPPNKAYDDLVAKFVTGGMGEALISRYFRGPNPLYATQIFIPGISADDGPKAFNLSDKVQPRRWIVVYKGKVTPPESGNYRFVGFADDVLVVRFNGTIVLDGSLSNPTRNPRKQVYNQEGMPANLATPVGSPFEVKVGTSYPIEVLIGERPGGFFSAFLLLEKIGANYEKDAKSNPKLPLFKLEKSELPGGNRRNVPVIAPDNTWSLWKAEKQSKGFPSLDGLKQP